MGLVVRAYEARDREGFANVRSVTYRGAQPVAEDEQLLQDDCLAIVADSEGAIVGACTGLAMSVTHGYGELPAVGLAAVAVVPERRRSGVGAELLQRSLAIYRAAGFVLGVLYPFRASYYRKFGYANAGSRLQITCPSHRLPKLERGLAVRHLRAEEHRAIRGCYGAFARKYAGMNLRGDAMWWRQLGGNTPFAVYAAGDPIEAYAAVRLTGNFWDQQSVREIAWTTPEGYAAILGFFRDLAVNKSSVQWPEPQDSPFLAHHFDEGVEATFANAAMYRILDVRAALKALAPTSSGEFSVKVRDPLLPENEGPWSVRFHGGLSDVTATRKAHFELDIASLTQAFVGDPCLEWLAECGRVTVYEAEGFRSALKCLPRRRAYCADLF